MRHPFRVFCAVVVLLTVFGHTAGSESLHMLYMAQAGYQPSDILERAESFEEETGTSVELSFVEYEEQYELIRESSSRPVSSYDVILLDLIWTAEFAERGIIDPLPDALEETVTAEIVPEIYSAFAYDDALWAMPFLGNFQLMYTNMSLLGEAGHERPPETLEELKAMARDARDAGIIDYPIFLPLSEQETLVCVFVWLTGAYGGSLTDETGSIAVNGKAAVEAVSYLQTLLDEGLLNPYSLQREEVFTADVFLAGDSLFTVNWTFLGGLIDEEGADVRERSRASVIPVSEEAPVSEHAPVSVHAHDSSGGAEPGEVHADSVRTSTVSGYQGLAVPANSAHPEKSWELIRYMAAEEFQSEHPTEMPVWQEILDQHEAESGTVGTELKRRQLAGAKHRPIHPEYRMISERIQHWVHRALLESLDPGAALDEAQSEIEDLID